MLIQEVETVEFTVFKRVAVAAVAAASMVLAPVAPAVADEQPDPGILSPSAGGIVYTDMLYLSAVDSAAAAGLVNWAVRAGSECTAGSSNLAGGGPNVNADDPYAWMDGAFSAEVDVSGWDPGEYCFVFNPTATPTRLVQAFYVVDEYVKIGGTILDYQGQGEQLGGVSPTHAIEGLVGDAGLAGIVGSVSVNYRLLRETLIYHATALTFAPASGVQSDVKAVIDTTEGAQIQVLGAGDSPLYRRGAIVLRPAAPYDEYWLDNSLGAGGAGSWVEMDRGNNHVVNL